MTIRVHIGAHKTASTEIQQALRSVRPRLEEHGMGYVGPRGLRGDWIQLIPAMFGTNEDDRKQAITRLKRWLARYDNHLISEENIIGTLPRHALLGKENQLYPFAERNIQSLRKLMKNPEIELFLAIRDPASFITSAYGQIMRQQALTGIDYYTLEHRVDELSWADLAGRLVSCPGVTRLICWRYEDYTDLRPTLLSLMLGEKLAAIVPDPQPHNIGISEAAYQQFVEWVMGDDDSLPEDLLRKARKAFPKQPGESGMRPLPEAIYSRSAEYYTDDVRRLSQLEGVVLLSPDNTQNTQSINKSA